MIYFGTPGPLDPRAVLTFGLSAKETENPIGYFGTGLKYALAILAREGARVTINGVPIRKIPSTFRGKAFDELALGELKLPFTTELGKNWKLWMAFRELYSNTLDERGAISDRPVQFETIIAVDSSAFEELYHRRFEFFIRPERKPLYSNDVLEIYEGETNSVFLKGIKVFETAKHCNFTYNFLRKLTLSEERTADYFSITNHAGTGLAACTNKAILRKVLIAGSQDFEHHFNYSIYELFSKEFREAAVAHRTHQDLNPNLIAVLQNWRVNELNVDDHEGWTPKQQEMLRVASDYLAEAGYSLPQIYRCNSFGETVLGRAHKGCIWLTDGAFASGPRDLLNTLLHEHLHIASGHADETRAFEDYIVEEILVQIDRRL